MIAYRAMCKKERDETVKSGTANFHKRFKWFATNIDFINSRVRDGAFNNSMFKPGAYEYVIAFDVDVSKADFVSRNEIQFDRRRNPTIKVIKELS